MTAAAHPGSDGQRDALPGHDSGVSDRERKREIAGCAVKHGDRQESPSARPRTQPSTPSTAASNEQDLSRHPSGSRHRGERLRSAAGAAGTVMSIALSANMKPTSALIAGEQRFALALRRHSNREQPRIEAGGNEVHVRSRGESRERRTHLAGARRVIAHEDPAELTECAGRAAGRSGLARSQSDCEPASPMSASPSVAATSVFWTRAPTCSSSRASVPTAPISCASGSGSATAGRWRVATRRGDAADAHPGAPVADPHRSGRPIVPHRAPSGSPAARGSAARPARRAPPGPRARSASENPSGPRASSCTWAPPRSWVFSCASE